MQVIALQPVPSQKLQVVLGGQNCQIAVYQKLSGMYVDVSVNSYPISLGVLALDTVPLVPTTYFGFAGNLLFTDTLGSSDPAYSGLGTQYQLLYLTAAEYALI